MNKIDDKNLHSYDLEELLSYIDINENYKNRINNILDISLNIDCENQKIELFNEDDLIGKIYSGVYNYGDTKVSDHIGLEVNEKYRKMGFGEFLFNLYKKHFIIPDCEYSREKSKILFLCSMGYKPISIINDINGEETDLNGDEVDFDVIGEGFSCKMVYDEG